MINFLIIRDILILQVLQILQNQIFLTNCLNILDMLLLSRESWKQKNMHHSHRLSVSYFLSHTQTHPSIHILKGDRMVLNEKLTNEHSRVTMTLLMAELRLGQNSWALQNALFQMAGAKHYKNWDDCCWTSTTGNSA